MSSRQRLRHLLYASGELSSHLERDDNQERSRRFRIGAPWQLTLIERSSRTWFASCHIASRILGHDGIASRLVPEAAVCALAAAIVPLYACLPDAAARRAAAATASPSVELLKRAWYPFDSWLLVCPARLLERIRGLSLTTMTRVGGVPCTVCATGVAAAQWRALKDAWARDPHHLELDFNIDDDQPATSFDIVLHVHGTAKIVTMSPDVGTVAPSVVQGSRGSCSALVVCPNGSDSCDPHGFRRWFYSLL